MQPPQLQQTVQPSKSTENNNHNHILISANKYIYIFFMLKKKPYFVQKLRFTYLVVPGFVVVEDHSWSETPCRVNAGSSDRDCSQVNHEDGKPNGKWC